MAMAQSSGSRSDPDDFIEDIDPGLLTYKHELYMRSVTSFATLKFLRPREVQSMQMPEVYKRLLIDKIISLQSPDTKKNMKSSTMCMSPLTWKASTESEDASLKASVSRPSSKRLRYDNSPAKPLDDREPNKSDGQSVTVAASPKVKESGYLEHEITKLQEQRDTLRVVFIHKKDELELKKVPPVAPKPLAIPGNPVSKLFCDNCHHKGHRAHGNKGNKSCPFPSCGGYTFCGLLTKHKEYKQELTESEKEVAAMEKELRELDSQLKDIRSFMMYNTTNFVAAVKPCLKAIFPAKYTGKDGALALQRDIRLIKISLNGKIPENVNSFSKEKWENLLQRGRSSIFVSTGESLNDENNCGTDLSPQSLQTSSGIVTSSSGLQYTQSSSMWNAYQPIWPYLQYPTQSQYAMDIQSNYVPSYGVGASNYGIQPSSTITRPPVNQFTSPPLPQRAPFAPPLPPGPPPSPKNL